MTRKFDSQSRNRSRSTGVERERFERSRSTGVERERSRGSRSAGAGRERFEASRLTQVERESELLRERSSERASERERERAIENAFGLIAVLERCITLRLGEVRRKALRVIPRGKQRLTVYRAHQVTRRAFSALRVIR